MKAAIHYVVKGKFIRFKKDDQIDFVTFEETFKDEIPILAREKAFLKFNDHIENLILSDVNILDRFKPENRQSISAPVIEEPQVPREDLSMDELIARMQQYAIPKGFKSRDAIGPAYGIGIYCVLNVPIDKRIKRKSYVPEDCEVYGIDYDTGLFDPEILIDGLASEYEYYEHFNYDTKGYAINIKYLFAGESEPLDYIVLKTPTDWDKVLAQDLTVETELVPEQITGDTKPTADPIIPLVKSQSLIFSVTSPESIEDLLIRGEGKQIEYKSTLLFNPRAEKAGLNSKGVIAKTICSFLNSVGGFLLIGINDDGIPIGLKSDFRRSGEKGPKDFFQLEFDQMLSLFFKREVHVNIIGGFAMINDIDIFIVKIWPSFYPVFIKVNEGKQFYIRGTASSQWLSDPEEIVNYCLSHRYFAKS
ncbi:MAG: helix-turn-helix domain-containing protein [Bacteroidales bacterium]